MDNQFYVITFFFCDLPDTCLLISENCILGSSVAYFLRYSLGWRVSSERV